MTQFSSRPSYNDDPLPYVTYSDDRRTDVRSKEWDLQSDGAVEYVRVYDPRPEYTVIPTNPTNPALQHFRFLHGRKPYREMSNAAVNWVASLRDMRIAGAYTADQEEHARKVLTRLANLSKRRTLVINGVAIDIPEDAFVDIRQFSHLGNTAEHVRTIAHLPEQFDPPKTRNADNTVWMSRETPDETTEWTVFLS